MMDNNLINETNARTKAGSVQVSMQELERLYSELGYKFDRTMDTTCNAQYMTGPQAGTSYPCLTLYPRQIDNGLSAWNIEARRDDNYRKLQEYRNIYFSVHAGRIIEI